MSVPPAKSQQTSIHLTNYTDNTTIRHPVPLIRGTIPDANATSVTIINTSSTRPTSKIDGQAHKGKFKVLAELVPGPNKLVIKAGKDELPLMLNYKPQTNPYVVRVFLLTDNTGNTEYQTPIKNDPQDYRGNLATAMKLMQTFTAERMYDLGFGRVTFNLELDEAGQVIVRTLQAEDAAEHYYKMTGLDLWNYTDDLIRRKCPNEFAKNLVIPAFTRFDPNTKQPCAHTALGGSRLALFGGANLFTWPGTIAEAQTAFTDTTTIDTARFFSDSVGRHTFWAAASTTIGAALHELGHTFDLPHSQSPQDIMTRGFDHFNRAFTFVEPPHAQQKKPYEFSDSQVAQWAPPSAAWLKFSRWFALDEKDFTGQDKTLVTADHDLRTIRISSQNGIGAVILGTTEIAAGYVPIDYNQPPPQDIAVSMAEFGKFLTGENPAIRIIDALGFARTVPLRSLMHASFIRAWRFASITAPWNDQASFVPIHKEKLEAIRLSAASNDIATSPTAYVDFLPHFPNEQRQNIVGYVVRTFNSHKPRDITIFTGTDDALRLWLNGKLITQVLSLRTAEIDAESADAALLKGNNTIIAEVSQKTGGWGLYLRIEDKDGNDLIITDDGRISEIPDTSK
ncbi:MAG: hypothetical protein JXN61_10805 [Sedimentisphaerales bacterium]|nr:hypothetical protein [Sedimentisphaerales bacterium]